MKSCRVLLTLIVLAGVIRAGHADILRLAEGDTLTGDLVRVREGILVFRTALQGQMMVPMDRVAGLTNKDNLVITLTDDRVHYGRFTEVDNRTQIEPINAETPIAVQLGEVEEALVIPSPPEPKEKLTPDETEAWQAAVDAGVLGTAGEEGRVDAFSRLALKRQRAKQAFDAELLVAPGFGDAPSIFRGHGEMAFRQDRRNRPYARVDLRRDLDAALDLQTTLSLGITREMWDKAEQSLEGRAGLAYNYEEWNLEPLEEPAGLKGQRSAHEDDIEFQLGLRYSQTLFGNGALENHFLFYPSLTDAGDVRSQSETAVSWPLTERLRLRLDLLVDYDSDPEITGIATWRAAIGAGFRWNF